MLRKTAKGHGDIGFTLIEALISMVLLILVWLAVFNVILVSRGSGSVAKHKIQAMHVIQKTIEDLRKKTFVEIVNETRPESIDRKDTYDTDADDFKGTQVVTVTDEGSNLKKVTVTLSWNEISAGRNRTVREYCGTYIANDPQVN